MKYILLTLLLILVLPIYLVGQTMLLPVPYHSQGAPNNPADPGYPPYPPPNNWCTVACLHMLFDYYDHMGNKPSPLPALQIASVCNTDNVAGLVGAWAGTYMDDARRAAHFSVMSNSADTLVIGGYTWRKIGYSAFEDTNGLNFLNPGLSGLSGWMEVLNEGYPVIFNGRFPWEIGPPEGAVTIEEPNETVHGHSILLIGYEIFSDTILIFHDPWYGPYVHYDIHQFYTGWTGEYIFASPWEIKINAPDTIYQGDSFYVAASVRYTAPTLEYVQPTGPTFGQSFFPVANYAVAILEQDSCTLPLVIPNPVNNLYRIEQTQSSYACYWKVSTPSIPGTHGVFRVKAVGELLPSFSRSYPTYQDTLGGFVSGNCTYVGTSGGISEESISPSPAKIAPNPFRHSSVVTFRLSERGRIRIDIFDEIGRVVKTLLDRELEKGEYRIPWYGRNENDQEMPSGEYFYRIYINDELSSKKAILLK